MNVESVQGILVQNTTLTCFGLSYLAAFLLEVARLRWQHRWMRPLSIFMGAAGLLAHSIYLAFHYPTPASAPGALLSVAWVLAVFYLYGTIHYNRRAWAVFVLPFVLGFTGMAYLFIAKSSIANDSAIPWWIRTDRVWGAVHGVLLLFAAVGLSVGAIASAMYLIQSNRLRKKLNPLGGMKIFSLERLETMNRRAINTAFPFLTGGLLIGAVLLRQYHQAVDNWFSLKVLGTMGLWVVFLFLMYLRYTAHVPGRRLAQLTIFTFLLMLMVLVASHPFATAGGAA